MDREIFKTGTWNGTTWERKDLEEIVRNFETQHQSDRVPVVLGHNAKVDAPAYGWIKRIYVQNDTLRAVLDLSTEAKDWIASGKYKFCSVELLKTTAGWVLDKLGLLGAARPGVGTIEPLSASRRGELRLCFNSRLGETDNMTEIETLRARLAAAERKAHVGELKRIVQETVNNGSAAPATVTLFSRQFGPDDGDAIMRASPDDVRAWLRSCAPRDRAAMQRAAMATRAAVREDDDFATAVAATIATKFDALVATVRKELGVSERDMQDANKAIAVFAVVKERNPSLWSAHAMEPWAAA